MKMDNSRVLPQDKKYIFFDLDGTLTDPFYGITRSVKYALNHFGVKVDDLRELSRFIGPPLTDSFMEYYGLSKEQAAEAVEKYRERFSDTGIFENEIYDGIKELLGELKSQGRELYIATSKPEVFAQRIAEHFEIEEYFTQITGSLFDGTRVDKAEVIAHLIETTGIADRELVIMAGDRLHDIVGARKNGIESIGVSYGYGGTQELEGAGATYVTETVEGLRSMLTGKNIQQRQ